jgi:hypothetical protein
LHKTWVFCETRIDSHVGVVPCVMVSDRSGKKGKRAMKGEDRDVVFCGRWRGLDPGGGFDKRGESWVRGSWGCRPVCSTNFCGY